MKDLKRRKGEEIVEWCHNDAARSQFRLVSADFKVRATPSFYICSGETCLWVIILITSVPPSSYMNSEQATTY